MAADLCAQAMDIQQAQAKEIHHIIQINGDPRGSTGLLDEDVLKAAKEKIESDPRGSTGILDEDVLKAAKEKIESDISDIKSKIHKFPANLRGFGTDRDYIAPWIVAIGPYYHGVPGLQALEKVKRMAAYCFCEGLAKSPEEVYKKIFPVACDVRGCYADADALEAITDDDFAAMMFFDGCFLVQCMDSAFSAEQSLMSEVIDSKGRINILRDIMLLENQIPWPVLHLLTALIRPSPIGDFIGGYISSFRVKQSLEIDEVNIDKDIKPPHLLGLMHFYQVRWSFVEKESRLEHKLFEKKERVKEFKVTTSAAELAEIGIKLTSSWTTQFSEMKFLRGPLFGTLSLAPMSLSDDVNACLLVNMVAFEQCTGTRGRKFEYPVNSYLAVLAQLMQRDDDVHELRGKGIVHSTLDYHQTLKFFNRLVQHLRPDLSYYSVFQDLEEYKQKRWVSIAIHKFLYNNGKTIAAVLSIVSVLVGIFKTLVSLKQHQP